MSEPVAVEQQVARDMVRRGLPVAPVIVLLAGLGWGADGALSAAYAIALVLANFAVSAFLLARAARVSPVALLAAALGGYLVRMALILLAILAVRDQSWFEPVPLGVTLVVTHLGLLIWETGHVSASLAFPGLKPKGR